MRFGMFQIKKLSLIIYLSFLILFVFFDILLCMLKLYFVAILFLILLILSFLCFLIFSKYRFLALGTKKVGYICDYTYHPFGGRGFLRQPRSIPEINIMADDKKIWSRDYFGKEFSNFIKKNLAENKKMYVDVYFIKDKYYVDFKNIRVD